MNQIFEITPYSYLFIDNSHHKCYDEINGIKYKRFE